MILYYTAYLVLSFVSVTYIVYFVLSNVTESYIDVNKVLSNGSELCTNAIERAMLLS